VGSLFGGVATLHLAVFQNSLYQKQLVWQLFPKQQVVQVTIRPPETIVCVLQAQAVEAKTAK
jgi:hypothetical protein